MAKRVRPAPNAIRFRCFTYDPWPIVVAGNLPELGNWNADVALPLRLQTDSGGRREWAASFQCLPGREFEFKFVAKADWGVIWESGENRRFSPDGSRSEIAEEFRK